MPNLSYLSPKTGVKASPIHGSGLFARAFIAKGEIVAINEIRSKQRAVPGCQFQVSLPRK
jgi:hypothetical protein